MHAPGGTDFGINSISHENLKKVVWAFFSPVTAKKAPFFRHARVFLPCFLRKNLFAGLSKTKDHPRIPTRMGFETPFLEWRFRMQKRREFFD